MSSVVVSFSLSHFRIKRVRDKYEAELQELERSERKLQERCNELKGRLSEAEGEIVHLRGLLRQKEQEAEDIRKVSASQGREQWLPSVFSCSGESSALSKAFVRIGAKRSLTMSSSVVHSAEGMCSCL